MYSMNRISSPCFAAEPAEGHDVLLGDSLHRHRVDLHRVEAGRLRGEDALDDLLEPGPAGQFAGTVPGPSCRG